MCCNFFPHRNAMPPLWHENSNATSKKFLPHCGLKWFPIKKLKWQNIHLQMWNVFGKFKIYAINIPSIYLYLIFSNFYFTKLIFELDFLSIWNLIFESYTCSKNHVWNRQKNQVQKSSSKINFVKYSQVQIDSRIVLDNSSGKRFSISCVKNVSHLHMDIFCHFKFCHNRINGFCQW